MKHIGIDPDTDKSGFAISEKGKFLLINSFEFWDLIEQLRDLKLISKNNQNELFKVWIDAGWLLQKSNWHYTNNTDHRKQIAISILNLK